MTLSAATIEQLRTEPLTYNAEFLHEVMCEDTPDSMNIEAMGTVPLLAVRATHMGGTALPSGDDALNHIGRTLMVGPSYSNHDGWIAEAGPWGTRRRIHGARINPEPVNGGHYRIIERGGYNGYLVRYNDEAHRGERTISACPWSIIEVGWGHPIAFGDDGFGNPELGHTYIRVTRVTPTDMAAALLGENTVGEPTEPVPATVPPTNTVLLTEPALHNLGKPVSEGSPVAELDPERVVGKTYLIYSTGYDTRLGYWGEDQTFHLSGYFDGRNTFSQYSQVGLPNSTGANPLHWVEYNSPASRETPTADQHDAVVAMRRRTQEQMRTTRQMRVLLNEMARDRSWCPDYERSVQRIGIMDTNHSRHTPIPAVPELDDNGEWLDAAPVERILRFAWDFEVDYNGTFELSSPSNRLDEQLGSDMDLSIETSNMTFDASGSLTVYGIEVAVDVTTVTDNGEAAAREALNERQVREAIESRLSDGSLDSLDGWSVSDATDVTEEADWYDSDDYSDIY